MYCRVTFGRFYLKYSQQTSLPNTFHGKRPCMHRVLHQKNVEYSSMAIAVVNFNILLLYFHQQKLFTQNPFVWFSQSQEANYWKRGVMMSWSHSMRLKRFCHWLIVAQWRHIVAAAYCVKPYIFRHERIPPNLRCCNFLKVDIIIVENPLQKLRIFTFWLFLGVSLRRRNPKKFNFFRGCGEKITRLILRLVP